MRNPIESWSAYDRAQYTHPVTGLLTEHTLGMSHPERVAFLANELSLLGDDEDLTASKAAAWTLIDEWEAACGGRNQHVAEPFRTALNAFATAIPAAEHLFSDAATAEAL